MIAYTTISSDTGLVEISATLLYYGGEFKYAQPAIHFYDETEHELGYLDVSIQEFIDHLYHDRWALIADMLAVKIDYGVTAKMVRLLKSDILELWQAAIELGMVGNKKHAYGWIHSKTS